MWITNGNIERIIDENEVIPSGFIKGRKPKQKKIDILITKVSKEDLIKYYIIDNHSFTDTLSHFNLSVRKDLRLLLSYYGIAKSHSMSAKYAKRNVSHEDYLLRGKKSAETHQNRIKRKNNNQFCRTLEEQNIYDNLITIYPDLIYDEKIDDRYPYYVDFYIKSLDLFIEYQGHSSHGSYPYIENDIKSIYEVSKLYGKWREQYMRLDFEKYKTALKSNINFIRVYPHSSLEENIQFNNNKYVDIIKLIYNSSHKK